MPIDFKTKNGSNGLIAGDQMTAAPRPTEILQHPMKILYIKLTPDSMVYSKERYFFNNIFAPVYLY
jgi:hypothetical protein